VTILIFIIPILVAQIAALLSSLPEYKNNIQNNILPLIQLKLIKFDPELSIHAKQIFFELINNFFNSLILMFNNFWTYTKTTIGIIVIIILVPIISFYLLLGWVEIIESIKSLFPKKYKETIIDLFNKIDILLGAYIRGQLNVCLILACYYSALLSLAGLEFSFLIGTMSGFLLVIPFIGTAISFVSSLFIVYLTGCDYYHFIYILLIYLFGHIMEAYVLAPKIIGGKLGLNPAWILFAVLTGATSFGFIGVLISIPIAGIVKVCLNFFIGSYKQSKYYN
jgi:putative permease